MFVWLYRHWLNMKNVRLLIVLHGYDSWSLTLRMIEGINGEICDADGSSENFFKFLET